MNKNNNVLIFAHYHSKGLIRKDILNFLKKSKKFFTKIIFVSTKIKDNEIYKIPSGIKIIKKRNVGYDFCSYKKGLVYLSSKYKRNFSNKNLFFINSSILFIRPEKLLNSIARKTLKNKEFWGLSRSLELTNHIGTYCFFFSGNLFENENIFNWWKSIKPLDDRNKVVSKYELGLSNLMIKNNIELKSFYKKNIELKANNIFEKISQRYKEIFFKTPKYYKKNPINYFWKDFYNKYGIIKVKLIKENNTKYGTEGLRSILKNKNLLFEALNN